MHSMDLIENYIALWIAIENGFTVETAFHVLDLVLENKKISPKVRRVLDEKDVDDMIKFKDEMHLTCTEIGMMYGISESEVYRKIRNCRAERTEGQLCL
ncbi:hypothetical protein SAMN02745945_01795 [Peptoclostridium litorale DSM 5388]|uniref:Mor transcription activator domain-containing protein n=1 Tax=Peptoclostridium litorale DSM 5388 TaxID=1121324 RepID=A0A069RP29_PEPLI|nr:hypothetical protein [Peptoclostridium litorale]KDR95932.1 hypothetical protein CLIT_8c01010 [Peptoclostridium litorale DSM 5388]SIO09726.1 hypothetical protein SAMN02745945_01795 [Peptoclostridium litorale DSM 5388]